jgi:hypothetical protein
VGAAVSAAWVGLKRVDAVWLEDDRTLTFLSPSMDAGNYAVSLRLGAQVQTEQVVGSFKVLGLVQVTSVAPSAGALKGGATVTLVRASTKA